jgi:hypothetical protein
MGELNPFAHEAMQQEVSALLRMHWAGESGGYEDVALPGGSRQALALSEGLEREAS